MGKNLKKTWNREMKQRMKKSSILYENPEHLDV